MSKKSGNFFAVILLIITFSYGVFQARTLLTGPTLEVYTPRNGETVVGELVEITGRTSNVTHVTINGTSVVMNTLGEFSEKLVTPEGYGVILVEAKNRFGHHKEERIELYGDPFNKLASLLETT